MQGLLSIRPRLVGFGLLPLAAFIGFDFFGLHFFFIFSFDSFDLSGLWRWRGLWLFVFCFSSCAGRRSFSFYFVLPARTASSESMIQFEPAAPGRPSWPGPGGFPLRRRPFCDKIKESAARPLSAMGRLWPCEGAAMNAQSITLRRHLIYFDSQNKKEDLAWTIGPKRRRKSAII